MNLILHEAPRLLANILILQPIDERYIWMPTTAILGEPHIATHGEFIPSRPDNSYLVLGDGNTYETKNIQTLRNLDTVHLVVLSDC
ncbi:MAG: hypothetical protein NT070_11525 [Cyanobacteria bacterium]|nr:hypothetical protein [Cyanobacteriota bacterium]